MIRRLARIGCLAACAAAIVLAAGLAVGSDSFVAPSQLPDGSTLYQTTDVFAGVADNQTAAQLRAIMPGVLSGTEYKYVLGQDSQREAEWGIVVFEFADEETALRSFQHLAAAKATVSKKPYTSRIDDAEGNEAIQNFLASGLEYACLIDEIVVFPKGRQIIWVDDYTVASGLESEATAGIVSRALKIAETVAASDPGQVLPDQGSSSVPSSVLAPGQASEDWPQASADSSNTRASALRGPTEDLSTSWELRSRDIYENGANEYFDAITNVSQPVVSGNYVLFHVTGFVSGFYREALETLAEAALVIMRYTKPPIGPPSVDIHASMLFCVDRTNGEIEWVKTNPGTIIDVVLSETHAYVAISSDWTDWKDGYVGGIAAIRLKDGSTTWDERDFEPAFTSQLLLTPSELIATLESRFLSVFTENPAVCGVSRTSGDIIWRHDLTAYGTPVRAAAAAHGRIVLLSITKGLLLETGELVCLDLGDLKGQTPEVKWVKEFERAISHPVLVDGRFAAVEDGEALYVHWIGGEGERKGEIEGLVGTPAARGTEIVFPGRSSMFSDHTVYCYDVAGPMKSPEWSVEIPDSSCLLPKSVGLSHASIGGDYAYLYRFASILSGAELLCLNLLKEGDIVNRAFLDWTEDLRASRNPPRVIGEELVGCFTGSLPDKPKVSTSQDFTVFLATPSGSEDITVEDIAWVGELIAEQDILFAALVKNTGESKIEGVEVCLAIDGQRFASTDLVSIEEGATLSVEFAKTWVAIEGMHTVSVEADCRNSLAEGERGNNSLAETFEVLPSPETDTEPGEPTTEISSATVLVIDTSRSMTGTKLQAAKKAALNFINMLEDEMDIPGSHHQIGIVTFSAKGETKLNLTANTSQARAVVNALTASASTNLAQGLVLANRMLRGIGRDPEKVIVLLSDGKPTHTLGGQWIGEPDPDGVLRREILLNPVAHAVLSGACIHVVGFGDPRAITQSGNPAIDVEFLETLAAATGCGEYYTATNASELRNVYIGMRHGSLGDVLAQSTGDIQQNQTVAIKRFEVPADQEELHFTLDWDGSRIDPILVDPIGRTVDGSYPGAAVRSHAQLAHIAIANPLPGTWEARALGVDIPEDSLEFHAVISVRNEDTTTFLETLGRVLTYLFVLLMSGLATLFQK